MGLISCELLVLLLVRQKDSHSWLDTNVNICNRNSKWELRNTLIELTALTIQLLFLFVFELY